MPRLIMYITISILYRELCKWIETVWINAAYAIAHPKLLAAISTPNPTLENRKKLEKRYHNRPPQALQMLAHPWSHFLNTLIYTGPRLSTIQCYKSHSIGVKIQEVPEWCLCGLCYWWCMFSWVDVFSLSLSSHHDSPLPCQYSYPSSTAHWY